MSKRQLTLSALLAVGLSSGCSDPAGEAEEVASISQALSVCDEVVPAEHYVDGIPAYAQCTASENSSIYSNNGVDTSTTAIGDDWVRTQWSGGYQCTEFATRYLVFRWDIDWRPNGNAGSWCDETAPASSGVEQTSSPVHGDVMVFPPGSCGADATAGHVAVVDTVDAENARVTFVEQNRSNRRTSDQSCAACFLHVIANDGSVGSAGAGGAGGAASATGGAAQATGGAEPATGGAEAATGGAEPATGGAESSTGGAEPATGGAESSAGGAAPATGGAEPATGGAAPVTGGVATATGGALQATGGAAPAVGGAAPGAAGALSAAGGAASVAGSAPLAADDADATSGSAGTVTVFYMSESIAGGTARSDAGGPGARALGYPADDGGCGCRIPGAPGSSDRGTSRHLALALLGLVLVGRARSRRSAQAWRNLR